MGASDRTSPRLRHKPVTAFISYKWQDHARNSWVEQLYRDLRRHGIDAKLDRYEVRPGESLSNYMTRGIGEADYVLFVVTPASVAAVESGKGSLAFEIQLANALKTATTKESSIIPLLREGDYTSTYFLDCRYIDFRDDDTYQDALMDLVRWLNGEIKPPSLGTEVIDAPMDQVTHLRSAAGKHSTLASRKPNESVAIQDLSLGQYRHLFAKHQADQCATIRTVARGRAPHVDGFYVNLRLGKRARRIGIPPQEEAKRKLDPEHLAYARNLGDWHESARRTPEYELLELEVDEALEKAHIVILGDPGSGKSTLLQFLAWKYSMAYDSESDTELFPVFLRLPALVNSRNSLRGAVANRIQTLFPAARSATQESILEAVMEAFASGRALLLLDGLDEVAKDKRMALIETIRSLTEARIVVTSRYVGYNDELSTFEHLELAPLSEPAQRQMIRAWFNDTESTSEKLIIALDVNARIRALASNPLLLSIICFVFEETGRLPRHRHKLYQQATQQLLLIENRFEVSHNILTGLKVDLLSTLCTEAFPPGYDEFEDGALYRAITAFGRQRLPTNEPADIVLDLMHNSGLIYRRPDGKCLFIHLTFQEYFAAVGVASMADPFSYVRRHLHSPIWREVILLTAGLLHERSAQRVESFVGAILDARSPYEGILHRDLLLAGRILGEDIPIDPKLRERILNELQEVLDMAAGKQWRACRGALGQTVFPVLGSMAASASSDSALAMLTAFGAAESYWRDRPDADSFNKALANFPDSPEIRNYIETVSKPIKTDVAATVHVGESRAWATNALALIGSGPLRDHVRQGFVVFLESSHFAIRWAGAHGLGLLRGLELAPEEFGALARAVRNDRSAMVRTEAVRALRIRSRKSSDYDVTEVLYHASEDRSVETRREAIRALANWSAEPHIAGFSETVAGECADWRSRLAAAEGLAKAGEDSYLYELLRASTRSSPRPGGYGEAILSVGKLRKQREIEPLMDSFGYWLFRYQASNYSSRTGGVLADLIRQSRRQELLHWAREVAATPKHRLRRAAICALGLLGDSHLANVLVNEIHRVELCADIAALLRASGRVPDIKAGANRLLQEVEQRRSNGMMGAERVFLEGLSTLGPQGAVEETVRLILEEFGLPLSDKHKMLESLGEAVARKVVVDWLEDEWKRSQSISALNTLVRLLYTAEGAGLRLE